ncbi:MAG: hypothetical protein AB1Z98_03370 [Nannocystaceae bacterium]
MVAALVPSHAQAAAPIYYNSLASFQADVTATVTDDYSNPGYVFIQNNAAMSAVLGETDYESTGFTNLNIVSGVGGADPYYCAGCNGSFELSFQTSSLGDAVGIVGVGVDIQTHNLATPYYAYITFGDGTTENIALPGAGSFWGVAAPERIERIHFGLTMGGTTTGGSFGIDNLIIGDGAVGTCMVDADCVEDSDPCTDVVCNAGLCGFVFNTAPCDDDDMCTELDTCNMGVCSGPQIDCEDGDPCTTNFCQDGVGCSFQYNTEPCEDGDACTQTEVCTAGACGGGTPIECDDADPCTVDSCDPELGCLAEPVMGCCQADEDCGADEMCDVGTTTCVPVPSASTGGDGTAGAEGGESGVGDTMTPGGDTGASTGGGGGEAGGALTFGDADVGTGGCACTTAADPSHRQLPWLSLVLLGLWRRRSRARRYSA